MWLKSCQKIRVLFTSHFLHSFIFTISLHFLGHFWRVRVLAATSKKSDQWLQAPRTRSLEDVRKSSLNKLPARRGQFVIVSYPEAVGAVNVRKRSHLYRSVTSNLPRCTGVVSTIEGFNGVFKANFYIKRQFTGPDMIRRRPNKKQSRRFHGVPKAILIDKRQFIGPEMIRWRPLPNNKQTLQWLL